MPETIFLVHAAACLFMTGVIWFVQVVHYPLFFWVHPREFVNYSGAHRQRTWWVVAPAMFVELGAALWLAWRGGIWPVPILRWVMPVLLVLIWALTIWVQIPQHRKLGQGFDGKLARQLVSFNWLRTGLWSLRSLVILWTLAQRSA